MHHQRVFRALGFEPKTIDVRDLPAAVADGTVDAQENPLTNIFNFDLYEHHRHITLTRHLMGVALALFNKAEVASWSEGVREQVMAAISTATVAQRHHAEEDDVICTDKLRKAGVEIHELTQEERQLFVDATSGAVAQTRAQFAPELVKLFDDSLAAG